MDVDEAKESAADGLSSSASSFGVDASCAHESMHPTKKQQKRKRASAESAMINKVSSSAEWRREIDELFEYYKDVSGPHLNPEELSCSTVECTIACLLEESSLPCAKLTDEIYKRMKLQDGVTESSVRSSVLIIGKRFSYGISSMDADELEDESESSLWCWETRNLELLPSHLHSSLSIRRKARKLICERILFLSGNLAAIGSYSAHGSQNSKSVNVGKVLNLDGIRSFVNRTKLESKTKVKELRDISNAVKDQQKIEQQIQKEQKKKESELKRTQEKAEKEVKRIDRENKRLKKQQEEVERERKRQEKEQAELKRQASIQKQANIMARFLKRKTSSNMDISDNHHSMKTTCSRSSGNIEELAIAATSAMDCTLSQANCLKLEDIWEAHVAWWRKCSQHNKLCRWGVRRSPKIQLFHELKLQKSPAIAPSEIMSTPTKEQSSQMENPGSLDLSILLDQLKTPSYENNIPCKTSHSNTSSSVLFVKLLQFDRSHRPAYYGTRRKKSFTVSARHPFQRDPDLSYEVDSDEEWEEEDPGESLSDFDDDEETMKEHDSKVDTEDETENSFIVPDDYLSEDEGVQYEPLSGKCVETSSLLSVLEVTIEELNVLLQRQKALHGFTEHALRKDRPLVISNLDHSKVDLLKADDIAGILKVEQLCLQALCMRKYPGGPIVDVPVNVSLSVEDQEFRRSNKRSPSTPVASKSISDSDIPEFVKLIKSCPHGMGKLVELLHTRFPYISKAQLKNKIQEIAEFTNSHWQVKKDILDRGGLSLSPGESFPGPAEIRSRQTTNRCPRSGGSAPHSDP
uniref:Chromatin assembly factor 1 subunit FSM n=2 Tax=Arundo donax TaxID=35708 RepID=A0A0A9ATD2_ARUDO